MGPSTLETATMLMFLAGLVGASLSISSASDIKASASQLAFDTISYYKGNESGQTPGNLPNGYDWYEAGALWGTMVDYWHFTGDSTYNDLVTRAMLFQVGPNDNYMPLNQTALLANDDQCTWAMSAVTAAENRFPDPPVDQPQWLDLARAVFDTQIVRQDDICNGGLRWQILVSNNGYNYKDSLSNGCFFNLAARLARYTANQTYFDSAEGTWNWMRDVGFMDDAYNIYDGAHVEQNCTDINRIQWSYNSAVYLHGAAHMYNHTNGSQMWQQRVQKLLNNTVNNFFPEGVAYEQACEGIGTCPTDVFAFKGYLHRALAATSQLAPFTKAMVSKTLQTSTAAAIKQCTGGSSGRECGFQWANGTFDGTTGFEQEMSVLSAVSSLLLDSVNSPATVSSGGADGSASGDAPTSTASPSSSVGKTSRGVLFSTLALGQVLSICGSWVACNLIF